MLAVLIGCGLRRGELLALRLESLRQREEHWVHGDTTTIAETVTAAADELEAVAADCFTTPPKPAPSSVSVRRR